MEYGPRHRVICLKSTTRSYPGGWFYADGRLAADRTITINTTKNKVMDDVVTENFFTKRNRGELINNPCDIVVDDTSIDPIHQTSTQAGTWARFDGYINLNPLYLLDARDEEILQEAAELAGTRAYAKCTSNELNALVTIGELKETKAMLLSLIDRLWVLGRLVAKKYPYWLVKVADPLDFWLEIRYGWRPFIAECKQLSEYLQKKQAEAYAERQTFRSHETLYNHVVDNSIIEQVPSNAGYHTTAFHAESLLSGGISAGLLAVQRYAGFPDVYGLTKIPSAIYDLTRLSFAVNWFFNIAELIAAWTPDTLWDPKMSWSSEVTTHSQRVIMTGFVCTDSKHLTCNKSGGVLHVLTDHYHRKPAASRGITPTFRVNFDKEKYVDAVALLKQFWYSILGRRVR